MTDFALLLRVLTAGGVEFVIIGGIGATAHGSAHVRVEAWRQRPANVQVKSTAP